MSDDSLRDAGGRFIKGNPGGPGRSRLTVSRGAVELDEMGADVGKKLLQVIVDKALEGDMRAGELLLSQKVRERGRDYASPAAFDPAPLVDRSTVFDGFQGRSNGEMP